MSCVPPEPRIENMLTDHGADVSVLPPEIQAICREALVSSFNHENVLHRSTFLDTPNITGYLQVFRAWPRQRRGPQSNGPDARPNNYDGGWLGSAACWIEAECNLTDDTTQEFLSLARTNNRTAFDELAGLYMTRYRIQGFWDGIRQRVGEGTA